jgi:hypothetical protein
MKRIIFNEETNMVEEIDNVELPSTDELFEIRFDPWSTNMRIEELAIDEFGIFTEDNEFFFISFSEEEDKEAARHDLDLLIRTARRNDLFVDFRQIR